jgi:hypothetical protein
MSVIWVRSPIQRCCPEGRISRQSSLVSDRGPFLQNAAFSRRNSVQLCTPNQKSKRWTYQNGNCRARLAIRRSGSRKNISGTLGIRTLSYRALPLRAARLQSLRRYNVFERSLGGLLKLASQDSNRSLGRFCLYVVHDGRRCPIPSKFPVQPGASFRASQYLGGSDVSPKKCPKSSRITGTCCRNYPLGPRRSYKPADRKVRHN